MEDSLKLYTQIQRFVAGFSENFASELQGGKVLLVFFGNILYLRWRSFPWTSGGVPWLDWHKYNVFSIGIVGYPGGVSQQIQEIAFAVEKTSG